VRLLRLGRTLPRRPALQAEAGLARLRRNLRRTGAALRKYAAPALLVLALLAAGVLLLAFSAELTFFQDSWEFLMNRRGFGADALLEPHNEHIVVLPVAIVQLLLRVFGMSSAGPEFAVLIAMLLVSATLVFVYVRRRLGEWLGLMAAVLLLFLGPAWMDLLWPFEIGFVGSVLFGVAMLLALDREDERGDAFACGFLVLSIAFSSLGFAFAVGALVDVFVVRHRRGWRRVYVAVVPLLLYAAWFAGWGHEAEGHLSLHNVLVSPRFVVEAMAAAVESLVGMSGLTDEPVGQALWGPALLVAVVALLAWARIRRGGSISPRLWAVAATAATFWFLAGFNFIPGREAWSSRYLYAGAVLVLLIAADLFSGARIGRRGLLACGVVTLLAAGSNIVPLRDGRDFLESQTVLTRSDLGAIEIARLTVDPSFGLAPEIAGTPFLIDVTAGEYLSAVDEYGSPAYTSAELERAAEFGRVQADVVLANALPVSIEIEQGAARQAGRCVRLPGDDSGASPPWLRSGLTKIALPPGEPGTIRLRRFAVAEYPLVTEGVPGGSTILLRIPADGSARPWRLWVEAAQGASVCRG
jgi:hypothetical protein